MGSTRTTLNIDDELLRRARECTGIQEKTALIHTALRELIAKEAGRRVHVELFDGAAFWALHDRVTVPKLIEATAAWAAALRDTP